MAQILDTVLVTGSHEWEDVGKISDELITIEAIVPIDPSCLRLVHGGCRGADFWAARIAANRGWTVVVYNARWKKEGRAAGPLRNKRMLNENVERLICVLSFGDLSVCQGTKQCTDLAKAQLRKNSTQQWFVRNIFPSSAQTKPS